MSNLKLRIKTLENLVPKKPWFCIEINGDATEQEQKTMKEAHDNGRTVCVFQSVGDTLGIWDIGANRIAWGADYES